MQYATLGRTGLRVSRLGFGAMRLPMKGGRVDRLKAIPLIHRAFQAGVNYIDTAIGYCNGDSQRAVGEALKGWRHKTVVSTKNHYYNKHDDRPWWKHLEDSLRRLDVECLDVYNFHNLSWQRFVEHLAGPGGQLSWMHKARDQGLIRHIGFSCHDTPENLIKLAKTGELESVILQYNLLDRTNEKALPVLRRLGLGVTIMGPVGGGRLGTPSEAIRHLVPGAKSVPEVALRFVLSNPNVTAALSGMNEMSHVEENARVASRTTPLSASEKRRIQATLRRYEKLAQLYCTGCNYCMPCPNGVEIPRNFLLFNYARVYGLEDLARRQYRGLGGKASLCVACGACIEKCPQKIDIVAQLRETVRTLDEDFGKLIARVRPVRLGNLRKRNARLDLALECQLECHNLSDEDITPALTFSPGRRVGIELVGRPKRLGPFERGRTKLLVQATALKEGEPLALGASLEGDRQTVFDRDPLAVAIALKATSRSVARALAKAPAIAAATPAGATSPRALKALGLKARFAYTDEALLAEFTCKAPFHRPAGPRRRPEKSDNVALNFDFRAARGIRLAKDARKQVALAFAFGKEGGAMAVAPIRSRLPRGALAQIEAASSGRGTRRTVRLRIPWRALGVTRARPGARLSLNFALTSWPARGQKPRRLVWVASGTPWLLLA